MSKFLENMRTIYTNYKPTTSLQDAREYCFDIVRLKDFRFFLRQWNDTGGVRDELIETIERIEDKRFISERYLYQLAFRMLQTEVFHLEQELEKKRNR